MPLTNETIYECDYCHGTVQGENEEPSEVEGSQIGTVTQYFQMTTWACENCRKEWNLF